MLFTQIKLFPFMLCSEDMKTREMINRLPNMEREELQTTNTEGDDQVPEAAGGVFDLPAA